MSKNSNGGPCVQQNQEYSYDPARSLNRMVSEPYYLFHLLVFFSYIPIRCSAFQILSPTRNSLLLKRVEFRAFSTSACICTSSFFPGLSITKLESTSSVHSI
ncbi:hypothetical protein K7X08_013867 [Anisodus acutangulus]|uniref:Uncharacterized protein n=1 Tax=Anisodus acutangulus TaxID=402998 RepID=A0A9Q1LNQ9_9SOLA|nr:hypothetical protein K7X08_013867 [Anisodus acutangulus]